MLTVATHRWLHGRKKACHGSKCKKVIEQMHWNNTFGNNKILNDFAAAVKIASILKFS